MVASEEPERTSMFTEDDDDDVPSMRMEIVRSLKKLGVHAMGIGKNPNTGSFSCWPSCQTQSRALEMSNQNMFPRVYRVRSIRNVKREPVSQARKGAMRVQHKGYSVVHPTLRNNRG